MDKTVTSLLPRAAVVLLAGRADEIMTKAPALAQTVLALASMAAGDIATARLRLRDVLMSAVTLDRSALDSGIDVQRAQGLRWAIYDIDAHIRGKNSVQACAVRQTCMLANRIVDGSDALRSAEMAGALMVWCTRLEGEKVEPAIAA